MGAGQEVRHVPPCCVHVQPLDLPVKRSRESFDVAVTQTKKRLEEVREREGVGGWKA